MAGLDRTILDQINPERVLDRIKIDIRTDFIFSPHLDAIYEKAGGEVWNRTYEMLRSGHYQPNLPYTISVPKGRGFTRPGSILSPVDRFVYQALIDLCTATIDEQVDRTRVFSHVFSQNEHHLFQPAHECWQRYQNAVRELCYAGGFIVKADISNYFERIPQHHLINLLSSAGCLPGVVKLLEEMLLAFQERDSFGIVQGVYPSDILGDFYMSDLDAYFDLMQLRSARFNDDIYIQYDTRQNAQIGLIKLIERLRKNGLHLNEFKSGIQEAHDTIRQETEVDVLFDAAREEIYEELVQHIDVYGFSVDWEIENETDEGIRLEAVERLYSAIEDYPDQTEKIEKFCLPILRSARSGSAIHSVLERLTENRHLSRLYHSYLSRFVQEDNELSRYLENLIQEDEVVTDYEKINILGSLLNANNIHSTTVNKTLLWLTNSKRISEETRAVAAVFSAKHGNANQLRTVRLTYEDEPSEYVRSAILFSSQYLPSAERRSRIIAWGGHTMLNSLTAQAM